jgi:integrase
MPQKLGRFTDDWVAKIKPPSSGETLYVERARDKGEPTMCVRVSYGGTKVWKILYYVAGRSKYKTVGKCSATSAKAAYAVLDEFSTKKEDAAVKAGSFKAVAESWFKECVEAPGLASAKELRRHLETYIYPSWHDTRFYDIDADDVNTLLAAIRTKKIEPVKGKPKRGKFERGRRASGLGGPVMAEVVRGTIRNIMFWYAENNNYDSAIKAGGKRRKGGTARKKRKRFLNDDEIRLVWQACDDIASPRKDGKSIEQRAAYGKMVKLLLLTTQRLTMLSEMKWKDIRDGVKLPVKDRSAPTEIVDSVWVMPAPSNELAKGVGGALKLPKAALDILATIPKVDGIDYVFHARVRGTPVNKPINSFSQLKGELDALLPAEMRGKGAHEWNLHDLRRTARTLLPQAGVSEYVAERVLGHKPQGIEAVYNQYDYFHEKADALQRLADLVGRIIDPPDTTNVVPLRPRSA